MYKEREYKKFFFAVLGRTGANHRHGRPNAVWTAGCSDGHSDVSFDPVSAAGRSVVSGASIYRIPRDLERKSATLVYGKWWCSLLAKWSSDPNAGLIITCFFRVSSARFWLCFHWWSARLHSSGTLSAIAWKRKWNRICGFRLISIPLMLLGNRTSIRIKCRSVVFAYLL